MAAICTGEKIPNHLIITRFEPAQTIANFGATHGVDFSLMATYDHDGSGRILPGGVVDRVVRQETYPLILGPVREMRY